MSKNVSLTDRKFWADYWEKNLGSNSTGTAPAGTTATDTDPSGAPLDGPAADPTGAPPQPRQTSHPTSPPTNHTPQKPPPEPFYADLLEHFPKGKKTFVEVGGIPGNNAAYMKKTLGYDSTVLDFLPCQKLLPAVEDRYQIPRGSLRSIEADFQFYESPTKYDVVFSAGFLEHFSNFEEVLERHCHLLADNGFLFVSVPNFRGINGWFQRVFDPLNFVSHNLNAMDPQQLRTVLENYRGRPVYASPEHQQAPAHAEPAHEAQQVTDQLGDLAARLDAPPPEQAGDPAATNHPKTASPNGLTQIEVFYHGRPFIYLENAATHPLWVRRIIYLCSGILYRLGPALKLKGRWFSPTVVVMARSKHNKR